MITHKTEIQFGHMRKAGAIIKLIFEKIAKEIKPGITTGDLDQMAYEIVIKNNAKPAFKGYHGFPATICASVNDEIVHGIPGDRLLNDGDIVGVDVGAIVHGFFADAARTFAVGDVSKEILNLMKVTRQSLDKGIGQIKTGNHISDISHAVESHVNPYGYGIVKQYVGHGIGSNLHEEPQIPNYGKPNEGPEIEVGMAFAIEPMINLGTEETKVLEDGWTVVTADGKVSCHYENTILITENGREVITQDG
ncbi:MAG: methionyl aminopeptidase [Candidatus Omnitrophota bacterium]|jgi:methionyl aminopeptidase